ncbi:MAG TPA: alpha/beta hydrolase [Anaerolineae bacterium]|jgi:fermentation-respiration switch protein FrsA (DUF1100 family)|nr:alpha/beta hydrolase [Anaerolineae bacterium]
MLELINQFVYRPESMFAAPGFKPDRLGLVYEEASFAAADGTRLSGWYLSAAEPWLAMLYSHGNAGDIRDWVHAAPPFIEAGISLLIWDYRGFGDSAGRPSEKGLYQDGLAAWGWLRERAAVDRLPAAMLGKSLGSAVAIHSAASLPAADGPTALVLDSAFTSMRELVARHATWVPRASIPRLFESLELAPQVRCPTLVLHGGQDMLVPVEEGRQIYEALAGPKQIKEIPAAGHNDISLYPEYTRWIVEFLREAVSD